MRGHIDELALIGRHVPWLGQVHCEQAD